MSVTYQALLGETAIDADSIIVQELVAEKAVIANLDVTKNFYVEGLTELDDATINKLTIPTGAADGSILTSDSTGLATWKENVHAGDITGSASATVQHHKWIGNWDVASPYQKFNRVTHQHIEYRAVIDNVGVEPLEVDPSGTWEVVLSHRPDTVFEEKAQPLRNKTDVDVVDLTVHNSAKFTVPQMGGLESTPRYLVGTGVNKDILKWAVNLDAPQVLVRDGFYYPNDGRAEAGKVLTCIGNTGLCDWIWPAQANVVTMSGDVTGQSNASVVNTLAGGTIQVSDLLTTADLPSGIVFEETAQPLRNKTDADIVDLIVHNSLKLELPTITSGVFNLRYLVGQGEPGFNDCRWVEDLHARIVGAHYQFLYPAGGSAVAGKILRCVDATGLVEWADAPSTTLAGDVTGSSSATVVNTLAGGTIPVNQLVLKESSDVLKNKNLTDVTNVIYATGIRSGSNWTTTFSGTAPNSYDILMYNGTNAVWTSPAPLLPALAGDVTGSYGSNAVNTLAGGTIPVNQLVTITDPQILRNKNFEGLMYFSDLTRTKLFSIRLDNITTSSITNLMPTSTADQTIFLPNVPNSTDTLVGKNTTDIMKNKTLTDASNVVYANGIRNGATWTSTFGGAAPTINQVLSYNGANAVWSAAAPLVTLAGDVTGSANNNVVSKATTDFAVGRTISASTGDRRKKIVIHEEGSATDPMDHRFHGLGIQPFQLRYQIASTVNNHVFYAATSATASNELARISGSGDLSVARTISTGNAVRAKKITVYDEGVLTDPTDHRFMGLGVQAFQMRYQTPTTGHDHVFYAATSATASNEVFRVTGTGNVISTAKVSSATSQVWGWINTTNQGAYTGWNKDNGSGRTTFANQMGGGYGGWNWINYNNSNVQTPSGDPAMTLDRDGNLTVRGNLTVNGSMGQDETFINGYWRSSNGTQKQTSVRVIKTGKLINLSVSAWDTTTPSSGYVQWTDMLGVQLTIPVWARPSTTMASSLLNYHHPMTLTDQNNNRVSGTFEITYEGKLLVSPNVGASLINKAGWNPFSITYPTD